MTSSAEVTWLLDGITMHGTSLDLTVRAPS